jgi:flagellar basal-body rod protein FlgB
MAFSSTGIGVAQQLGRFCMIDPLFNQPNYLAAKKTLDAVALRHEALASNIANVETPGYRRIDLAPSFKAELERACAGGDPRQIASLRPALAPDATAVALSRDGNTVNLENEMVQMNKNSLLHTVETQLVSASLIKLRLAITGK